MAGAGVGVSLVYNLVQGWGMGIWGEKDRGQGRWLTEFRKY